MSLVVSWIGIDTHGPTSAYIVSDSRISWETGDYFDYGKKVFSSSVYPEIFGYAGDVLFPSIVLSQIITMIDSNILFTQDMTCQEKNKIVFEKILYTIKKYPNEVNNQPIHIIHTSRDTIVNGYPQFHQYVLKYQKGKKTRQEEIHMPSKSDILQIIGTGSSEFKKNYVDRYQKSNKSNTSRNVFHCFIDILKNTTNKTCGGPPQLVGMYRKPMTAGINYGIIYKRKRYFLGMEVPKECAFEQGEWRNERFELCSGITKKKLDYAKDQPDTIVK